MNFKKGDLIECIDNSGVHNHFHVGDRCVVLGAVPGLQYNMSDGVVVASRVLSRGTFLASRFKRVERTAEDFED